MARTKNTDNVATEITDAKAAKRQAKNEAKARLRGVIASTDIDLPEGMREDLALVIGTGTRTISAVSSAKMAVVEKIQSAVTVTEDEIWNEFKLGRAEMRKITVSLIKKAKSPEERVWISFDPQEGVYSLVAEQADVPSGWTGYRPVDVEDIEL
ncbi:MAG: hypothetical protein ACYTFK_13720 [Planctomycetota bacterium]|jgi:hypothetical protein